MEKSFNYGNVTGITSDSATISDSLHVGGLVGNSYMARISDAYNHGRVEAKGKLARGASCAGGLVGKMDDAGWFFENVYSAAPEVKGDVVGGLAGYAQIIERVETEFFDGTLVNIASFGVAYDTVAFAGVNKTTAELQSDTMVTFLNTSGGTEADRQIWTRHGGYPIFDFDTLKFDSLPCCQDSDITLLKQKPAVPLLRLEVSSRLITIFGVAENHPVAVFDMRGNVIAIMRAHGASVNLEVPRAGRYIVRSGSQVRLVTVR